MGSPEIDNDDNHGVRVVSLALLAVFPACETNTCRIRQVLNGGAKVRVIGMTWLVV